MKYLIRTTLVAALLTATIAQAAVTDKQIAQAAIQSLKNQLKDPDSAKFSNVQVHRHTAVGVSVCGLVIARNGFGGYNGQQRFYVNVEGAYVFNDLNPIAESQMWAMACEDTK